MPTRARSPHPGSPNARRVGRKTSRLSQSWKRCSPSSDASDVNTCLSEMDRSTQSSRQPQTRSSQGGWFPPAFAIAGWILVIAWVCFGSIVVAVNTGTELRQAFAILLYVSSPVVLAGPLWLISAGVLAFRAGLKSGVRSERIELLLLLTSWATSRFRSGSADAPVYASGMMTRLLLALPSRTPT